MSLIQGIQVIPADIEAVLITHPAVAEAAVIGVRDELCGERPRAFVVRSKLLMADQDDDEVIESIDEHVQDLLHETHWLHERIEFVKEIPKSQNGKILRRVLRQMVADTRS
jgi:acyl-coenzyme A synthetase/AMP-(fatty) acid ligase